MIRISDVRTRSSSSRQFAGALWVCLCCLGLLAPSSVGGVSSSRLSVLLLVGMLAFGVLIILISGRLSSPWALILGLTTGAVPWLVSSARMGEIGHAAIYLGAQFLLLGLAFCLPMT